MTVVLCHEPGMVLSGWLLFAEGSAFLTCGIKQPCGCVLVQVCTDQCVLHRYHEHSHHHSAGGHHALVAVRSQGDKEDPCAGALRLPHQLHIL
jgi:hypothetical protein